MEASGLREPVSDLEGVGVVPLVIFGSTQADGKVSDVSGTLSKVPHTDVDESAPSHDLSSLIYFFVALQVV